MKLISLNLWGGRAYDKFSSFLEREKEGTDIFCFQEVLDYGLGKPDQDSQDAKLLHQTDRFQEMPDLYPKLEKGLKDFNGYLTDTYSSGMERLSIFVKKSLDSTEETIQVHETLPLMVHGKPYNIGCIMQHVNIKIDHGSFDIANVHGLWQHSSKDDTPERLNQSKEINRILSGFGDSRILCGDFNLLPNTESIRILEKDMKNLIKEYNVTNTRSSLYTKSLRYADYVFVSDGVNVNDFRVLDEPVSDHLPLLLDFS